MQICSRRTRWQLLSTLILCIMALTQGISLGWFSPTLPTLISDNSPIGKPIDTSEVKWIGAAFGIGCLFCNVVICVPVSYFGIKKCMYFVPLPNIINWILIYFASKSVYFYVCRVLLGFSGGTLVVCFPVFIAEVSDNSIRGTLGSFFMMTLCSGITVGFVLVYCLSYHVLPCVVIVLPILYLCLIIPLPEPPQDLLKRGHEEKAEKSFCFYNNLSKDPARQEEIKAEFDNLRNKVLASGISEKFTRADFFNKVSGRAFGLIAVLLVSNQMSGSFAIFNYASTIFEQLGSRMEPNLCGIFLGVVQIFGLISAVFLVDRVGRRRLLIPSLAGVGLAELGVGLLKSFASQEFLDRNGWIGLTLMGIVAYMASAGIVALTFVIIVELLPLKIRAPGISISMCGLSLSIFIALMTYPVLINDYGLHVTMFMSASFCLLGLVVLGIFLPETRGKSIIQ
ncbi:facilitated trehalose transporter Tret1-2 homolog isoform X1 [Drosophila teissieri]|uniref:facilitated trehalose transporter Tret1-2 homolog isoform X1 n=2 Tax=Drosophila teissieri TaxID=7243 RepID=UPI001CB9F682|nr:facilitated trehalose transporter Tret1-2 homolog isoform X1 [Drosophila teissieri]XP_043653672.1 facilitated trehalose transporter Tret1-2 homolog isoform X1 [Drosophila teissieri]